MKVIKDMFSGIENVDRWESDMEDSAPTELNKVISIFKVT